MKVDDVIQPLAGKMIDHLVKKGWQVRTGSYSTVLNNGEMAIKINREPDPCGISFIRWAKENPSPHLPKIGLIKEFSPGLFLINMELLHPINKTDAIYPLLVEIAHMDNKHHTVDFEYLREFYPEYKAFLDTMETIIKTFVRGDCFFDISNTNIMKRSDGTFVITDPIATDEDLY